MFGLLKKNKKSNDKCSLVTRGGSASRRDKKGVRCISEPIIEFIFIYFIIFLFYLFSLFYILFYFIIIICAILFK
jgi:hypothetical protein